MTIWMLEAFNTDSRYRDDIRYREYTRSRLRAEAFARIPKIQFSDSGHGIVFRAVEMEPRTRRLPTRTVLADYVREHLTIEKPSRGLQRGYTREKEEAFRARDARIAEMGEAFEGGPTQVEVLLAGLGVESLGELRRLTEVARELESGVDRLTGSRYAQMNAVANAGPIISVLIVVDDVELGERDEETAASFARLAVRKANRDRSEP